MDNNPQQKIDQLKAAMKPLAVQYLAVEAWDGGLLIPLSDRGQAIAKAAAVKAEDLGLPAADGPIVLLEVIEELSEQRKRGNQQATP